MVLTARLTTKFVLEESDGRDLISVCVYMCIDEYMCVLSRMVVRLSSRKIIKLTV